jgi:hypothetical protein
MEPMLGDRDGFRFRGGSLALDFTATLAARKREQTRELLETPAIWRGGSPRPGWLCTR